MKFFTKFKFLFAMVIAVALGFSVLNGCDDSGNVVTPTVDSGVVHFDSIGVTDGIGGTTFNGINLYNGTTVPQDSTSKDVQLLDSMGSFINFILRSGDMSDFESPVIGFQTRFNRIYASMTQAEFDTITKLPVGRDTILPDLDFTADDTYGNGAWGYFNVPMSTSDSKPVFSFWLKGKSANFIGRNVYGIIYPREATLVGGTYRMSFEVKINTLGYNHFYITH